MKYSLASLFVVAGCLAATGVAAAQDLEGAALQRPAEQQPGPGPGGLPGLGGDMSPAEIQRLFDAYLIMQAQQALELTDQQYPQFLAKLKTLQDTRRRTQQERLQLMNQLQRLSSPRVNPPADEGALKERLSALQELESRSAAEMRKAYNDLDQVLTVRQQARFRVFEEQIERRKIELLMRARQQQQLRNPQRRQPPPPPGL